MQDIEHDSSFDDGKYSPDLDDLLRSGSVDINPVFCIGLSRDEVHKMRNAYMSYLDLEVRVYGFYNNHNIIPKRVGIAPRILVLSDIDLGSDDSLELKRYVRSNRIPILRVLDERKTLVDLPKSDYYTGVYETIARRDLGDATTVTTLIELGIRIFYRNRGVNAQMSEFVKLSLQEILEIRGAPNADHLLKHLFS
jgi:hypothetical protein